MSRDQLSIQEIPNILKIARQNAALGLYPEAIRSYSHALHVVSEHFKSISDPFLKDQWRDTDKELRKETEAIYKLHKSLKGLRGEGGSSKDVSRDEIPLKKPNFKEIDPDNCKPPPSVIERFGGQPFAGPFVGKAYQEGPSSNKNIHGNNEPKKDPMVWDPPSPQYQKQKKMPQKKLPKWAQQPKGAPKNSGKPAAAYFQILYNRPHRPSEPEGARKYAKPWLPSEPQRHKSEEIKGQAGDQ